MSHVYANAQAAATAIRELIPAVPTIGVVLGSGLGGFSDALTASVSIEYEALPHWPRSTVPGHDGRLTSGTIGGRAVVALGGRSHLYEGHPLDTVTFAVRVLGLLGVRTLILTNAAGGINTGFSQGALMVVDDHINLMGRNPLVGPNDEQFGSRFPDMTHVYSARLRAIADRAAHTLGIPLLHGVYAALSGPSYETPAEIRYLRTIGADAVGMSTVPEAIVARHMGLEVLGLSCISNMAAGVLPGELNHAEVVETTGRVRGQFMALLEAIIGQL